MKLGQPIVYSASENARTITKRGDVEVPGSHHHTEMDEFAGVVARVHEKQKADKEQGIEARQACADLIIFPPGKTPVTVEHVQEGDGPGKFRAV